MLPRITHIVNVIRTLEKNIFQLFGHGHPPRELALVHVHQDPSPLPPKKFMLQDLVGDGFLYAVPKFRRTIEKRWKRKYGVKEYVWKIIEPKTNILVCQECGNFHERGRLCAHCYKKVEEETKLIKEKIADKLGKNQPIESDVIVLYEGETVQEQPKEFWNGKRVVEMKKERPQWFSKNLLQKSTQKPSDSTDVKPTDLA